jgi:adenosylhomocysteine nucleosidase
MDEMEKLMRIGILGAMPEEVKSIKDMMVIKTETHVGDKIYYEGSISEVDVVLTFSRWGKVASASTTTTLINKFDVQFVLFTGVAGAVDQSLNIGDVVIANGLYQHDMDARPIFDQYQIPLTSKIVFEPENQHVQKAMLAAENFVNKLDTKITGELLIKYSIFTPKVHTGMIASGDKFISDSSNHSDLKFTRNDNKTLAVEMEGAAVAQVCDDYKIPYVIIRTISDKADHSSHIDFQSFIKDIASTYSSEIVGEYILSL